MNHRVDRTDISSLPLWERMILKAYAKYYFGLISEVELSHILFTAERRRLTNKGELQC